MQHLPNIILEESKKEKIKKMEFELSQESVGNCECPACHYISKNKRFSGKIFQDEKENHSNAFLVGCGGKYGK